MLAPFFSIIDSKITFCGAMLMHMSLTFYTFERFKEKVKRFEVKNG